MPFRIKASNESLLASYQETRSVWKTAEIFNMCGQSVHERLTKLGAINPMNLINDDDRAKLLVDYERHADAGTLHVLATEMGRTKSMLCRHASKLGITNRTRSKFYLGQGISIRAKERIAINGHPRGMLGKTHSSDVKKAVSDASKKRWSALNPEEKADFILRRMKAMVEKKGSLALPKPHGSWKSAWRNIGGQRCFFRSRWEANYARYLEWLKLRGEISDWEHEPKTFWFEKIRRGTRSYLPDFGVTYPNGDISYHEVKGWFDDRSKTKLKRMAKYHPATKIVLIDKNRYAAIERNMCSLLEGWELPNSAVTDGISRGLSKTQVAVLDFLSENKKWVSCAANRRLLGLALGVAPGTVAQTLTALIKSGAVLRRYSGRYEVVRRT